VSGTVATVNLLAHGYSVDSRVRIEGSSSAAFSGHEYEIASAAENSFTIAVPDGTTPDASANIQGAAGQAADLLERRPGDRF
jgi:hypothetical protein